MVADDFSTSIEAAEILGYTVQHVRRLIREGKLPGKKLGRDWMVERAAVEKFMASRDNLRLPLQNLRSHGRRTEQQQDTTHRASETTNGSER